MIVEGYSQFGATERTAGALRNILNYEGVVAPHSGEPFTEAMLMGIGGGLGAEYATWAFKGIDPARPRKSKLYLRYHHVKNYIEKKEDTFLQKIAARIGAPLTAKKTTSQDQADIFLYESLQAGKPVMTQLSIWHGIDSRQVVSDRYHQNPDFFPPLLYGDYVLFLPYYSLPYPWISGYFATVFGIDKDNNQVHLTDYSNQPHTIGIQQFVESRGIIKGWKNAAYTLDPPKTAPDLTKTIRRGILDCTQSLLHEKAVISGAHLRVEAWQAIANHLTDPKSKRGWPTIFDEPWQIFDTLTRLHAQIAFYNSDGGALRSSYADFLDEASTILKKPALKQVSRQFQDVGIMWDEIGTDALPDDISVLRDTRLAALEWHNLFKVHGASASNQLEATAEEIKTLRNQFSKGIPLSVDETVALFQDLGTRFFEVYEAEKAALKSLHKLVK